MRLKSKLLSLNADKTVKVKVYTPANCDEVRIPFKKDKIAKVVGKLAELAPPSEIDDPQLMAGVLVQNGFNLSLMAPDDLQEYAGLTTTTITCKQHITLSSASMDLIRWALEGTFGAIEEVGSCKHITSNGENDADINDTAKQEDADEEIPSDETQTFLVMGCVYLRHHSRTREVELEWEGNMMNDGVADAVMAVLLTVESSPASVKRMKLILVVLLFPLLTADVLESAKNKHHHHHHNDDDDDDDDMEIPSLPNPHSQSGPQERLARMLMMLEAQFGGDNIGPIERPRVVADLALGPQQDGEESSEERIADIEAAELDRLITMGIPVPGIEIRVDKHIARVWLEDLEVECANPVLRDRIRVVVERAVETVAGLWAESSIPRDAVQSGSVNGPKGIGLASRNKAADIEAQG